ncbi:MAG: protein-methionine-sulfoxide reductase heme-binding subunit MsrQ [Acidobacteriaceae bacterium]
MLMSFAPKQRTIVAAKVLLWIFLFVPLAADIHGAVTNTLGANPQSQIELQTGEWTLRILIASLAITPLRRITGWNWLIRFRRLLGLFGFFYASLHFFVYLWFDQNFVWSSIFADIAKRRFIYIGFAAWLLMVPLALTSTAATIRKLGGKRWSLLHRLVYLTAVLGIIHFYWGKKADHSDPIIYGSVLAVLLATRIWYKYRSNKTVSRVPAVAKA